MSPSSPSHLEKVEFMEEWIESKLNLMPQTFEDHQFFQVIREDPSVTEDIQPDFILEKDLWTVSYAWIDSVPPDDIAETKDGREVEASELLRRIKNRLVVNKYK